MREFVFAAIFVTFFLAIGFIFFVVFNDVFYNPDSGLESQFNRSIESDGQETWNERMAHSRFFFQLAGVSFVGLCVLLLIIYAFRKRGEGGEF